MGPLDYFQNAHLYHFTLKSLTALLELAGFELVAGNNFVQGLFRKSQTTTKFRTPEKWYLILGYLYFTQLNHRLNLINLYRNYVLNPKRIFSLPKLLLVTSAQKIFGKERYLRIKNGILNRWSEPRWVWFIAYKWTWAQQESSPSQRRCLPEVGTVVFTKRHHSFICTTLSV